MQQLAFIVCALSLSSGAFGQATKHPYSVDDWASVPTPFPDAVSVNGDVLYDVTQGGLSGRSTDEWHTIRLDGTNDRPLEVPDNFQPTGFTKDGDLYGTFDAEGSTSIATFSFRDLSKKSLPKTVIAIPCSPNSVTISPDGRRFAILSDPNPEPADSAVKTVVGPSQTSLYVINFDGSNGKWWSPELKNINEIGWNPDGSSIAVISATPKIGYHYVKSQIDISDGLKTKHVADFDTAVSGIAWTNRGKDLAFLSTKTSVLAPDHVWTVSVDGGKPVDHTPNLAGSATQLVGDPNGTVWVAVSRGVISECDQFVDGQLINPMKSTGAPIVCEIGGAPNNVVFRSGDTEHQPNLAVPENGKLEVITHVGDAELSRVDFGPVKIIHWVSKQGVHLEGIATFPAGYVEGRKYPFVVLPHGGPEANDTYGLDFWSRLIAGQGYVVIQPQYRGSTGYGSDFLNAIYQHFGDRACADVDSATDYAIQQGWADPNRLAIFGWSAAGFISCWMVTQTDRYKAAIEGAGTTDWASFIWTGDVQQVDFDARWPGKEPKYFQRFSAVNYADRVTTPLLILHGANDRVVPIYQSQELFEALLAQGKVVRMVTYPGAGHFPSRWEQRRDLVQETFDWLKQHMP